MLMKQLMKLTSFVMLLSLASAAFAADIVKLDRIVAIVDQGVITEQELENRMQSVMKKLSTANQELPPDNILRKQILDRLIVDSLQLQYAEKTGLKVDENQVNIAIERIAEQNQLTITEFKEALAKDGIALEQFKADIKNEMILGRLREREINRKVTVSETEIDNALTTQDASPDANNEYEISHILIQTPEEATPEQIKQAKAKADEAFSALQTGSSFNKVSAQYSDTPNALEGGSIGWKKNTQIPTLFLDAIKPLQVGEHSQVLRSPNGFHILKLTNRKGGDTPLIIEQTHPRHILIKFSEIMSEKEAKQKIDALKIRLDNNESFETLARQYSEDTSASNGGDLSWVNPGDTVPPFEAAMNALAINQISEPVKTQFGWHLIQVLERRKQDMTSEARRFKARQEIQNRKADEAYEDWIRELRDRAFIELKLQDDY